ncbi:MAG: NAD(P)-dependent oxidoreductase [Nanoarchaeota archaeon]
MKILVTGASGFVGRNLLDKLENYEVNVLSRKKIPAKDVKVFTGDLFEKEILAEASKVDVVVHLAGIVKGNVVKVNYQGTMNLVDACVANKIKKFIFVSSYNAILDTKYGKSKKAAEEYIKNSGLDYIILRPTVIYGRSNNKDLETLISILRKFSIALIPGNGKMKLQPLLVDDLINVLLKIIKTDKKNKTYFLGGEVLSLNEIVDKICKVLSKKPVKINIPGFIIRILDKNQLLDKTGNLDEIKKDFGFNPTSFEKGIGYLRHDF